MARISARAEQYIVVNVEENQGQWGDKKSASWWARKKKEEDKMEMEENNILVKQYLKRFATQLNHHKLLVKNQNILFWAPTCVHNAGSAQQFQNILGSCGYLVNLTRVACWYIINNESKVWY